MTKFIPGGPKRYPHQRSASTLDAFNLRTEKSDGCWLWTGETNGKYGTIWDQDLKKTVYVHRWSYEHFVGPIPAGMQIDHVKKRGCTSKLCVNPAHLEPVDNSTNQRRATEEFCYKGHARVEGNFRTLKNGTLECLVCRRERDRKRRPPKTDLRRPSQVKKEILP